MECIRNKRTATIAIFTEYRTADDNAGNVMTKSRTIMMIINAVMTEIIITHEIIYIFYKW